MIRGIGYSRSNCFEELQVIVLEDIDKAEGIFSAGDYLAALHVSYPYLTYVFLARKLGVKLSSHVLASC